MSTENYVILEPLRRTWLANDLQQTPMKARCNLQIRDPCHQFLLRPNTVLGVTVVQMLKSRRWLFGSLMCTNRCPCAVYTGIPKSE